MAPVRERAELAVDERNELAGQVIRVAADPRGIHVLIAAVGGEAVGEDENARRHLALRDQPGRALGHVLVEALPRGVRFSGAGVAGEIEQNRIALAAAARRAL